MGKKRFIKTFVDINQIITDEEMSVRTSYDTELLKEDILIRGLKKPLRVSPSFNGNVGEFFVIDGYRRLKALKELGLNTAVPVVYLAEKFRGHYLPI